MKINEIRKLFPVTEDYVFFDNAAVAPISTRVRDAITAQVEEHARLGDVAAINWNATIARTRRAAAGLLGCTSAEIAFVKNTSEGLSYVINGFPFQDGDNVVSCRGEYPATIYPWLAKGIELRLAEYEGSRIPPENIFKLVDERTRMICISFVQYASGFRMDIARIGAFCRERDIFFLVDAIQGLGAIDFPVRQWNVDAASADAHKWLLGPEGIGLLFIAKERLPLIKPTEIGWMNVKGHSRYDVIDYTLKEDARKFEIGSFTTSAVYGLGAAIQLLEDVGIDAIEARLHRLTDYLCKKLRAKGYSVYSSREGDDWSGIVSFHKNGIDLGHVQKELFARRIVLSFREGRLRASPHYYNAEEEVDGLIESLP
jgi:selenocysteine lyase/cysteine desulfurase